MRTCVRACFRVYDRVLSAIRWDSGSRPSTSSWTPRRHYPRVRLRFSMHQLDQVRSSYQVRSGQVKSDRRTRFRNCTRNLQPLIRLPISGTARQGGAWRGRQRRASRTGGVDNRRTATDPGDFRGAIWLSVRFRLSQVDEFHVIAHTPITLGALHFVCVGGF